MGRKKQKEIETEQHVLVGTFVVEVPKGTDLSNMEEGGVIPTLVESLDEEYTDAEFNDNGTTILAVRDVALYTEPAFMLEVRRYGHPRRFPDVWIENKYQPRNLKLDDNKEDEEEEVAA